MTKPDDILDRVVLSLSDKDHVRFRDLAIGTAIIGSPDSGKTSTSGKQLAHGLLRMRSPGGFPVSGGLVLTAKATETENWIDYAKACGREKDLIIFNAESGHCFDPLHYEFSRPGRGAGDMEAIIDFFSTLVSIGKKEVGHGHDPFGNAGTSSSCATASSSSISRANAYPSRASTALSNRFRQDRRNTKKLVGRNSPTPRRL